VPGDLRLDQLRQIRRRRRRLRRRGRGRARSTGDPGRLAGRRRPGARDPRVDAVQILHARARLPAIFLAGARLDRVPQQRTKLLPNLPPTYLHAPVHTSI
jgi:hypothetical protein